ncbi:hypothetical protein Taro_009686 [Colocasia esculenta]|uniref:Uncharacterized protein n=1 Tax=Colocasia esculenta TaxID=4460 RepID=A0A843TX10_COLES|nr:hypothetical protein [Colocasia esculenta]
MKKATRVCAERDKGVRTGREIATGRSSRSERDGFAVAKRPQNAVYRAVVVAADEKGKKNDLVWAFHSSSATKSSFTRP